MEFYHMFRISRPVKEFKSKETLETTYTYINLNKKGGQRIIKLRSQVGHFVLLSLFFKRVVCFSYLCLYFYFLYFLLLISSIVYSTPSIVHSSKKISYLFLNFRFLHSHFSIYFTCICINFLV